MENYVKKNYGLVEVETGEIIDPETAFEDSLEATKKQILETRDLASEAGQYINVKISRKRKEKPDTVRIKPEKNYHFQKVFQSALAELVKSKQLNFSALAFITVFMPYIDFPDNCLIINGKNPSVQELGEVMGISRQCMTPILNSLEHNEVIKKVKHGKSNIIYFNPFIISSGVDISRETYLLFKNSIYNDKKE